MTNSFKLSCPGTFAGTFLSALFKPLFWDLFCCYRIMNNYIDQVADHR